LRTGIVGGIKAELEGTDGDKETDANGTPFRAYGRPSRGVGAHFTNCSMKEETEKIVDIIRKLYHREDGVRS
jgi:hypothetical protein